MRHPVLLLLLLLCWAYCAPGVQAQSPTTHVVQPGENLFRISLRYGITVDALREANGLPDHIIHVGQELIIPAGATTASVPSTAEAGTRYEVQTGDTLHAVALRHGVSLWALIEANGLTRSGALHPGQRLLLPERPAPAIESEPEPFPADGLYTVAPGDTLSGIARRFDTTVATLARLNGLTSASTIYAGQQLRLTGGGAYPEALPGGGGKRILINLSEQHLYAYEGERLIYSFVVSSGAAPYYTRTGDFAVQSKVPNAYGSTWNIWMPHWLGIYWAGSTENGIHALPVTAGGQTLWAGYLGRPVSYGCIVLGTYEALLLYQWAEIGTPVSIRY